VLKESSGLMSVHDSRVLIGYSVFDTSQECYEYNENACFIASTRQAAQEFLTVACMDSRDGRVDVVNWDDLLRDYGCSGGEYAMEADAFARFRLLAAGRRISFEAEAYDGDDSLMVVEIERRFLTPDPD
jgi:hypothetical protein